MSTLEKKINRLLSIPSDYTYDEAKALLRACGLMRITKEKLQVAE